MLVAVRRRLAILVVVALALTALAIGLFFAFSEKVGRERHVLSDSVRFATRDGRDLVATLMLAERSYRAPGRGTYGMRKTHGLDLLLHDARTGAFVERVKLVDRADPYPLRNDGRLHGWDGERLWLHTTELWSYEPIGRVVDGPAALEAVNPVLVSMLPTESRRVRLVDDVLQFMAADGITYRIEPATRRAVPYVEPKPKPARDHAEWVRQNREYNLTNAMWGIGPNRYFRRGRVVRTDRYIALLKDDEADEIRERIGQGFSENLTYTAGLDERRALYAVTLAPGEPDPRTEDPPSPVITAIDPIAAGTSFLNAGFLREPETPHPIRLANPDGFLLMHRNRIDHEGTLFVTRIDDEGRALWTRDTGIAELTQVMPDATHPVFVGSPVEPEGYRVARQHMVFVDAANGDAIDTVLE